MPRAHPALPMISALAGVAAFSVMDALMKRASLAGGVYNALLFRSLAGSLLMLPLWHFSGGRWPSPAVLKVHLLRSAVVAGMAWLFFFSLVRLPIAEAIALSFIAPLIALYLAAITLNERVHPRALVASLLGLAGVVVIAGARLDAFGRDENSLLGIAAALGSAVLYAWNLVLQRKQAQLASPQEVALFQNLCVGGFLALLAPWLAVVPHARVMIDITAGAALAALALMLLSWAYARAEAQALLATEYTAFIWASIMGWLWFDESVTPATLAGVALIVLACWIAARKPGQVTAH